MPSFDLVSDLSIIFLTINLIVVTFLFLIRSTYLEFVIITEYLWIESRIRFVHKSIRNKIEYYSAVKGRFLDVLMYWFVDEHMKPAKHPVRFRSHSDPGDHISLYNAPTISDCGQIVKKNPNRFDECYG